MTMVAILPIMADDEETTDDGIQIFAVATASTGDKDVFLGDSTIVTVTLYSNVSFAQIKNKSDKVPSVKNAEVNPFNKNRRMTQGTAIYKGHRYYAVAAEQFAVTPDETGTVTFPSQKYDVVLEVQTRQRGYDPFEDFFSFGSPFGSRTEKIKKSCTSEPLKIKVTKRPPKTIKDLQQSGATVM